jgi:hypothetical protein
LYDPDEKTKHTRIKFGNGKNKVKDLPFSAETDLTGYATEEYVNKKTTGYEYSLTNPGETEQDEVSIYAYETKLDSFDTTIVSSNN